VFSFSFHPKNFGFWPIILQNGTKHHAKFLAKGIHSPFCILASRGKKKKKPRSPHPPHEKIGILEHTHKIFWHFAFHYSKVVDILHFTFHGELNIALPTSITKKTLSFRIK
jgi:hypothetical protein